MTNGELPVDYSVITATLNEAENIVELIQAITFQLDPLGKSFEIIVVDDNSSDGTAALVRDCSAATPHVNLVSRPGAQGIGSAYLTGIQHSSGRVVCTMDADFSHPPEMLPQLLEAADRDLVVLGSRFLRRGDLTLCGIAGSPPGLRISGIVSYFAPASETTPMDTWR